MKQMPDRAELVNNLALLRGLIEYKCHLGDRTASCYLSGPVTGLPGANIHAFRVCASILSEAGWNVLSPFDSGDGRYELPEADSLCLLPGWEEGGNGRSEVYLARERGIPIFTYLNQRDVSKPGSAGSCSAPTERAGKGRGDVRASSFPTIPAMECIEIERGQQDGKWGEQNHDNFLWATILGEEFGEACMAALEMEFADSEKPAPTQEAAAENLRYELIQVAAVAVAWVECLDRNRV